MKSDNSVKLMLQENFSAHDRIEYGESQPEINNHDNSHFGFAIESELDRLKELVLGSTRIPLTELAIIDENTILELVLLIQENLPIELNTAIEIVNRRQEIIADAQGYACLIVKSAEEKAHQIVQESAIVRQAELDGARIRLKTEQECEQLKQQAIAECQAVQLDADNYADDVLEDLEQRLQEMLTIIKNGRQQLDQE